MSRRPRKAAAPAAAAAVPGNLFMGAADDDINVQRDQDLQQNLLNFLAAGGAKAKAGAGAASKAADPAAAPAANAGGGGGSGGGGVAMPGLLPLRRLSGTNAAGPASGMAAAAAAGGNGGSKRKAETALPAPGSRKQARGAGGAAAGAGAGTAAGGSGDAAAAVDAHLPADRDGVPSVEGIRTWLSDRMAALSERANAALEQQCEKSIEEGFNRLNATAAQHHEAVSIMLAGSSEALEVARSQHVAAVADIEALRDGLVGELDSSRKELLGALRSEVVAPLEAGLASLQARYKI